MSITEYEIDGKKFWRFYYNKRSRKNYKLRIQRTVNGFTSYEEAAKAKKKFISFAEREMYQLEARGCTWGEVVNQWEDFHLMYPSKNLSPLTIGNIVSTVKKWTKPWYNLNPKDLTRGDGRSVFYQLELAEYPAKYFVKLKSSVNKIYRWGVEEKIIETSNPSPMEGLEITGKREEKLTEILNLDQIKKLLECAKEKDHPWYPIWAFTLLTGCRSGEAHGLRKSDVELVTSEELEAQSTLPPEKRHYGMIKLSRAWQAKLKRIGPLKNREWRGVPVSSDLYYFLKEIMQKDFGSDVFGEYLLPRIRLWDKGDQALVLRQFCKEVDVPSVRFHTLRACFATHLLSKGVTSAVVMKICGWRDLKTMERYIRLAGVDTRGATEGLKFMPEERAAVENVVNFRPSPLDLP